VLRGSVLSNLIAPTYLSTLQLYCALEEWETGAFASVAFETSKYRMLYTAITDLNIRRILENLYMRGKLKALWARIYHHGRYSYFFFIYYRALTFLVKPGACTPEWRRAYCGPLCGGYRCGARVGTWTG
jgi:hypothetical protein